MRRGSGTMSERDHSPTLVEKYAARDIVFGGLFLALAVVVPYIFHVAGGGALGPIFLPMFLPVVMCGFLTDARVAIVVGALAPFVSSLLTGMPPIYPVAPMMSCEGMILGGVASVLYRSFKLNPWLSLGVAAASERLFLALVISVLTRYFEIPSRFFTLAVVVHGLPGIALQFGIVPPMVKALEKRIGGVRR